jgi:hypothetical protein
MQRKRCLGSRDRPHGHLTGHVVATSSSENRRRWTGFTQLNVLPSATAWVMIAPMVTGREGCARSHVVAGSWVLRALNNAVARYFVARFIGCCHQILLEKGSHSPQPALYSSVEHLFNHRAGSGADTPPTHWALQIRLTKTPRETLEPTSSVAAGAVGTGVNSSTFLARPTSMHQFPPPSTGRVGLHECG